MFNKYIIIIILLLYILLYIIIIIIVIIIKYLTKFFNQTLYGKKYNGEVEESFRMKIFAENKHKIAQHNKLHSLSHKTYSLRMNKYGDMVSIKCTTYNCTYISFLDSL